MLNEIKRHSPDLMTDQENNDENLASWYQRLDEIHLKLMDEILHAPLTFENDEKLDKLIDEAEELRVQCINGLSSAMSKKIQSLVAYIPAWFAYQFIRTIFCINAIRTIIIFSC